MLGNDICLCIAGNKIDLEKERHVSVADAEAYVISLSLVYGDLLLSSIVLYCVRKYSHFVIPCINILML